MYILEVLKQMLNKLFQRFKRTPDSPAIVEGEYLWCIVGNIVETHYSKESDEIKKGSKHFRPGAKVYCIPEFPGCKYESMRVIGKPRKQKAMIDIIIRTKLITNFRLQKVYSPSLFDKISEQHVYKSFWDYRLPYKELENILRSLQIQFQQD